MTAVQIYELFHIYILTSALLIPSDSSAIHELAVSSDLHWLACVDCNNTVNIFSFNKMKVLSFPYTPCYTLYDRIPV